MKSYRQVGGSLGSYIRNNDPSTSQIRAFLADLLIADDLLLPLSEIVARPLFSGIRNCAGTGKGVVQRDALLQEIRRSYLPSVVDKISEVFNGILDLPAKRSDEQNSTTSFSYPSTVVGSPSRGLEACLTPASPTSQNAAPEFLQERAKLLSHTALQEPIFYQFMTKMGMAVNMVNLSICGALLHSAMLRSSFNGYTFLIVFLFLDSIYGLTCSVALKNYRFKAISHALASIVIGFLVQTASMLRAIALNESSTGIVSLVLLVAYAFCLLYWSRKSIHDYTFAKSIFGWDSGK